MHARIVSLESINLQVERQRARYVLPARTPRQQGPLHARIVSLENMKLQVERQCARLVLPIRLRQSRAQHLCLVFVALVLTALRRVRVLTICNGRAVANAILQHPVNIQDFLEKRSMESGKLLSGRITHILGGGSISETPKRSRVCVPSIMTHLFCLSTPSQWERVRTLMKTKYARLV